MKSNLFVRWSCDIFHCNAAFITVVSRDMTAFFWLVVVVVAVCNAAPCIQYPDKRI